MEAEEPVDPEPVVPVLSPLELESGVVPTAVVQTPLAPKRPEGWTHDKPSSHVEFAWKGPKVGLQNSPSLARRTQTSSPEVAFVEQRQELSPQTVNWQTPAAPGGAPLGVIQSSPSSQEEFAWKGPKLGLQASPKRARRTQIESPVIFT